MTAKPEGPACSADHEGTVERDGVTIAYSVYDEPAGDRGSGGPTIVLLPTWSIVPSRIWKAQVPYLARHFRVVTFDGRGSGRSSAPIGAAAYSDAEVVADTLAVLDATGTESAVLVGFSRGCPWAVQVALEQPDRVLGIICIASAAGLVPAQVKRDRWAWNDRHYWLEGDYDDFLEFFFGRVFSEPHSSKQIEDAIGWGRGIDPARLVDTEEARQNRLPGVPDLACPVLVIHGSSDHVQARLDRHNAGQAAAGRHPLRVGSPPLVLRSLGPRRPRRLHRQSPRPRDHLPPRPHHRRPNRRHPPGRPPLIRRTPRQLPLSAGKQTPGDPTCEYPSAHSPRRGWQVVSSAGAK
ncbi:hypothetical protein GCM10009744_16340 [Kribbella alba]|uniref:AB hydrolase-1 domain-containing protein n=1 Tax=Kribbella alba TaxID=190197 RepID=A0ABN2F5U2_9ACTN